MIQVEHWVVIHQDRTELSERRGMQLVICHPAMAARRNEETPATSAPVHIEHAVQGSDSDLTEEEDAAWWIARRATIDGRNLCMDGARQRYNSVKRKQF